MLYSSTDNHKRNICTTVLIFDIAEGNENVSLKVGVQQHERPLLCAIRLGVPSR